MEDKVFVSYSHLDGEWVADRLVPVLTAGGADVLIDRERFRAGRGLVGEMDATQDAAARSVLVLSPRYVESEYCRHEMRRAVERDPEFRCGSTIPVLRWETELPTELTKGKPIRVDLRNDRADEPWRQLLQACGGNLGVAAPAWLQARDDVREHLESGRSVSLEVTGKPAWRQLVDDVKRREIPGLVKVDLDEGKTTTRRGLVETILDGCGVRTEIPDGEDLVQLDRILGERSRTYVAFLHADRLPARDKTQIDLFSTLRHLIMEKRKLVVLFQSRKPFAKLLPTEHPLSHLDVRTVELHGS